MKTETRFIPAGMLLRNENSNESRIAIPSKNASPKPNNPISNNHTDIKHSTSAPNEISPPKTICKNKGPVLGNLQSYNQNCIFDRDAHLVRRQLSTRPNKNFNACKTASRNVENGDCEENWNLPSTSSSQMYNKNTNSCSNTSQNTEGRDCEENWNLPSSSSSQMRNLNTDRCRKQLSTSLNENGGENFKACKNTSQYNGSGDNEINWDLPSTSSSQMHNQNLGRCRKQLSAQSNERDAYACKTTSQNIESRDPKRNSTSSLQMHKRITKRCSVNQNTTDETDTDSSVEANSYKQKSISSSKKDTVPEKNQRSDSDSNTTFETWCIDNIKFEESNTLLQNTPLLKSTTHSKPTSIKKIYNTDVVIHGLMVPKPVASVDEAHFHEEVKETMIRLNCSTPAPMQTYMWPAIQRCLNAFIVGKGGSRKTFSYLPAICTFALQKTGRYQELSKYQGPLIVILCPNDAKCQDVRSLINTINAESWAPSVTNVLHGNSDETDFDILITTPAKLEENLKTKAIKLERVCHVVLEKAHDLLKDSSKFMSSFFKILNHIQKTRPHNSNIQVIVCSEQWSKDLHVLVGNMHVTPVICFQDFLEAALYANVSNLRKEVKPHHKIHVLIDILRTQYSTHRTIVFCKSDEINSVSERLNLEGIEYISLSNDLIEDDIFENENMWSYLRPGRFKVLLCPDSLLDNPLVISNAEWIVHYSPPDNPQILQKRFRCLVKNLHCLLEDDLDQKKNLQSFFIAESESCNDIFGDYHNVLIRNLVVHFNL